MTTTTTAGPTKVVGALSRLERPQQQQRQQPSSSFLSSSTPRCMTHSEQAMLETALAFVLIQKRHSQRRRTNHPSLVRQETSPRVTGGTESLPTSNEKNTIRNQNHKDNHRQHNSISNKNSNDQKKRKYHKLLQQSHRDHIDHLFHVACRSLSAVSTTTSSSSPESSSSFGWISGIACHLVEQLDSWATELSTVNPDERRLLVGPKRNTGTTATMTIAPSTATVDTTTRSHERLQPLYHWMIWSLLSHPQAATIHKAMMHHEEAATRKGHRCRRTTMSSSRTNEDDIGRASSSSDQNTSLLFDCWWEVIVDMILDLYHSPFPLPGSHGRDEHGMKRRRIGEPLPWLCEPLASGISIDALAVSLLDLLRTLCQVSSSSLGGCSSWSSSPSTNATPIYTMNANTSATATTAITHVEGTSTRRRIPDALYKIIFPLPTPETLVGRIMQDSSMGVFGSGCYQNGKSTTTTRSTNHPTTTGVVDPMGTGGAAASAAMSRGSQSAVEQSNEGLTAGGKMLLRLGLYRIFVFEQRTGLDDEDGALVSTF